MLIKVTSTYILEKDDAGFTRPEMLQLIEEAAKIDLVLECPSPDGTPQYLQCIHTDSDISLQDRSCLHFDKNSEGVSNPKNDLKRMTETPEESSEPALQSLMTGVYDNVDFKDVKEEPEQSDFSDLWGFSLK